MKNNLPVYFDHYQKVLSLATKKGKIEGAGGQVRATTGKLVESLAELIWTKETGGTVKREKYTISNPKGNTLDFSVDKHCFSINGKLKLILECKAYLDRCFLARADHDINMIKTSLGKKNRNVLFAILALEDSCAANAQRFYLGRDNIDDIFFLLDGKRSSSKPIWKEAHKKQLNKNLVEIFVSYVQQLK